MLYYRMARARGPVLACWSVFRFEIAELARRYKLHANQIYKWKRELLEHAERVFEREDGGPSESSERESELLKKIGELTVERDFLSRGLGRLR